MAYIKPYGPYVHMHMARQSCKFIVKSSITGVMNLLEVPTRVDLPTSFYMTHCMRPGKVDLHYFTLYSLKFHILPQLFLAFTKFQQIFQHHNFLIIVFPKIEISRPGCIFEKLWIPVA